MKAAIGFAVAALVVVSLPTIVAYAWGERATASGVAVAAGVAYPIMVVSFALMVGFRRSTNRFLAVWAGGILARLIALGATVAAVMRWEGLAPAPTLLALAGFFFVLLLLEPVFFRAT